MRDLRRKRRQQRQNNRHLRPFRKRKYIPTQKPARQQYYHRHLKLNEDSMEGDHDPNNDQSYAGMDKHFSVNLRQRRRPIIFSKRHKPATERQAGLAGLFAVNPAGASLAWFASLAGLAFIAREPLSTVLEGVSPWDQILNSEYQVHLIIHRKIVIKECNY